MLLGSRLGRRLQETTKTREKVEKQAKRPFLHLLSPVLPEGHGLSLSQETGVLWKSTAYVYYDPATPLDPVSQP